MISNEKRKETINRYLKYHLEQISNLKEELFQLGYGQLVDGIADTFEEACDYMCFDQYEVLKNERKSDIVKKRNCIIYILKELGYQYKKIGAFFQKDHTTIIHSYNIFLNYVSNRNMIESVYKTEADKFIELKRNERL